jgi:hypothetical protein
MRGDGRGGSVTTYAQPEDRTQHRHVRSGTGWKVYVAAVVVGLLAAAAGAVVAGLRPARYDSVAALALDQPRAIAAGADAGVVNKLSALRLKYTGLVPTQEFAERLTGTAGLQPGAIRSRLFARASGGSLILEVGARSSDADTSHELAQAAADELVQYVADEQSAAQIPDELRFTMTVVTPASGGHKVVPTFKQELGAAGLAGLVVFAAVLAVAAIRTND